MKNPGEEAHNPPLQYFPAKTKNTPLVDFKFEQILPIQLETILLPIKAGTLYIHYCTYISRNGGSPNIP